MRTNFAWCKDCDEFVCAHTDDNCGIWCPGCDNFVCMACVLNHRISCWSENDDVQVEVTDQGTVYTFHQKEKTRFDDKMTVYSNEYGITQIIIKKDADGH